MARGTGSPAAKARRLRLTTQLGNAVTAVEIAGRYAYVGKGYRLLDLADPRRPMLADEFQTWDYAALIPSRLTVDGDHCYVAAKESGLLALELHGDDGTPGTTAG